MVELWQALVIAIIVYLIVWLHVAATPLPITGECHGCGEKILDTYCVNCRSLDQAW